MPKITYVEFDGTPHEVDADFGNSVMEAAVRSDVPGIVAECGGACACATCHVIVPEQWALVMGQPSDMEASMLEFAEGVQPGSRLSCQIRVTQELDGLVVNLPETQG